MTGLLINMLIDSLKATIRSWKTGSGGSGGARETHGATCHN